MLRWLVAALRRSAEEPEPECAESCLEALCDSERAPSLRLGEHEEAVIEAERRRWESHQPPVSAP